MKTKLKVRRMWANGYPGESKLALYLYHTKNAALKMSEGLTDIDAVPVAVIPLDDADALIVAAAAAHYKAWSAIGKPTNGDCMRAALAAIGVLPRARAKKGGRK